MTKPVAVRAPPSKLDVRLLAAALFATIKCGDLIRDQHPVYIPASATVQDACELLTKHGIHFAPVQSAASPAKFAGVFTYRSLCAFVLRYFPDAARRSASILNVSDFDLRQFACASLGPKKPALEYSRVDDFVHCLHTDSVASVAESFQQGWHRLSAVNERGEFVGVVTQAMVLRSFMERVGTLDRLLPQTICELFPKCCKKTLFSISENETVISALRLLSEANVSALAVTSKNGQLVSAISLEDIREVFRTRQLKMLFSEVRHFVVYIRSQSTTVYGLLAVHGHSKVSHAIQKMMNAKPHRIWVVDSMSRPTGVLSVSDVIAYLCSKR